MSEKLRFFFAQALTDIRQCSANLTLDSAIFFSSSHPFTKKKIASLGVANQYLVFLKYSLCTRNNLLQIKKDHQDMDGNWHPNVIYNSNNGHLECLIWGQDHNYKNYLLDNLSSNHTQCHPMNCKIMKKNEFKQN